MLDVARTIDSAFLDHGFRRRQLNNCSYFVTGIAGVPSGLDYVSLEEFAHISNAKFTVFGMRYESSNPFRTQTVNFPGEWALSGQTTGFLLSLSNSDFWPEFLDIDISSSSPPRVTLEENVHDYQFVKHLFAAIDADLCVGSHLGEYFPFADPDADRTLRFTKHGPQKLVRPLEENRLPYRGHGYPSPGPYDEFAIDPATGLPKWAWIVNEPFQACPNIKKS